MVEYISTSFKKLVVLLNILNSTNYHSCPIDRNSNKNKTNLMQSRLKVVKTRKYRKIS